MASKGQQTPFTDDTESPEVRDLAVRRQFPLWPEDIILDHSLNSRWNADRDTRSLGLAMAEKGQRIAVGIVYDDRKKPHCVYGFGRVKELLAANKDGPRRQVLCVLEEAATRKDRLILNVHENIKRTELTAIDMAASVEKMTALKMKAKEIAEVFGKDPAWVSVMKRLWKVSDDVKALIENGHMGYTTALDFTGWTAKKQKEVVSSIKESIGLPGGVPLPGDEPPPGKRTRVTRKNVARAAEDAGVSTPRMRRKSIGDACTFWSERVGKNTALPAGAKSFAKKVVDFYEGNIGDEDMLKVIIRQFGRGKAPAKKAVKKSPAKKAPAKKAVKKAPAKK